MIRFMFRLADITVQAVATTVIGAVFLAVVVVINFTVLIAQVLSFFIYGLSLLAKHIYKCLAYVASL